MHRVPPHQSPVLDLVATLGGGDTFFADIANQARAELAAEQRGVPLPVVRVVRPRMPAPSPIPSSRRSYAVCSHPEGEGED